jgi:signal transduction histidine kinase
LSKNLEFPASHNKVIPNVKVKFLLVDDLKENLLALEALMRRPDIETFQARSGTEALELLIDHDFALAIIDVQMPGISGFELAELMRGISKTKNIPIIFVTAASKDQSFIFKGYESGAVDFLYKPLDIHILKSKVNVFFDLYWQKCELREQVEELRRSKIAQDELLLRLTRTQLELERAVKVRDEFVSIASHELKTPLTSLKLQMEMRKRSLKKNDIAAFSMEKLNRMILADERQLARLLHLINDMLDISRINVGHLLMNTESFDLALLVKDLSILFCDQAEQIGCTILVTSETPVIGIWDRFRIEQVVTNLITNAMRYGAGKPISIEVNIIQNSAQLVVRDQGRGIAEANHARIFQRFERAVSASEISGLGLGLYIVSQILEAHRGSIRVESRIGEGAAFFVDLPLESVQKETPLPILLNQ